MTAVDPHLAAAIAAKGVPLSADLVAPEVELRVEVERLRRELDSYKEHLAFLERNTLPELRRTIQHHEDGKKRWRDRAEKAEARVRELERPTVEKHRAEIRSSYVELISQAEQDRDHEGAAQVTQLLADAEAKWRREDEEAAS
jgi:hypothetical protein